MQAKSETNVQTIPFIECSFAKVPSNQCFFGTMNPIFLLDSNFRNGYSLYHKVADLFDTFEGKFIPALRLLLVYLGDKCQRVPLLITRLRFQAPRVGELGVIPWVQILFFPLFSQLRRVKGGCVTLREEKFQEWIWWSWSNNSYYIYYQKVVGITLVVFPCVRKMTGPDTLFHQGDWKKRSFWLFCQVSQYFLWKIVSIWLL